MSQPPPVRFAIAGLGRIASTLEDDPLREKPASHAGAITGNVGAYLTAGFDPSEEKRRAFEARWKAPAFADLASLHAAHPVDVLCVTTPPDAHGEVVREAVRLGIGLLVCEKPLAPTAAEGRSLLALCRKKGVRLVVNHERRFCDDWNRVKDLVGSGALGSLRSVDARLFMGRTRAAGEMLLDDGTHLVDVLRYVTGSEFRVASASGRSGVPGGRIQALFELRGAGDLVLGSLEIGGGRDHFVFEADFGFEKGRVRIGNGLYEEWESAPSPFYSGARSLRQVPIRFETTGYFRNMVAEVVDLARDPARASRSSGEDGLASLKVIETILGKIRR